jgi:hypothetical protein
MDAFWMVEWEEEWVGGWEPHKEVAHLTEGHRTLAEALAASVGSGLRA